jgi:hypothetical protein
VAASAAAASFVLPGGAVSANPLGLPFGYQAWELAPDMKKDWDGTLKAMKSYGYSYIDLNQVSPYTDRRRFAHPGIENDRLLAAASAAYYGRLEKLRRGAQQVR